MVKKSVSLQNNESVLAKVANVLRQFENQDLFLLQEYQHLAENYKKLLNEVELLELQQTVQEIKEEKVRAAEEFLQTVEKRLAQFLEAVPVGVFVVDKYGVPYYANQKSQQILGRGIIQSSSIIELPEVYQAYLAGTTQLYPPERQPIVQALQGHRTSVDDMEIHQPNKIIPIEVWGTPVFDESGQITYAIAAFRDITNRKQIEKDRIQFTQELQALNNAYARFVPRQFLNLLNKKSIIEVQLGDQTEQEMTVLFSDMRDFTSISETMRPLEVFDFINHYLGQMEPIIFDHHGVVDKYIGDAIMAVFPISADNAVSCAITMLKTLTVYNQLLKNANLPEVSVGIGLNTGTMILGTIGGQSHMDGTVVSDAVNLASRVEKLTKIYSTPLLITEHTHRNLKASLQYHIRAIDLVKVKGKSEIVTIYEVYDADPAEVITLKDQTYKNFEEGFMLYHSAEFADAQRLFEKVLQIYNNDKVAQIYLHRCQNILRPTIPQMTKILIVDDMSIDVKILSYILTTNQFEVLTALDGASALSIVESQTPHLILLDVMMPYMNGFEVCRQLKMQSHTKDIPVIFISASTEKEDKIAGFKAGAVDYIMKPFHREEVLARIRIHLDNYYLRQQLIDKYGYIMKEGDYCQI
ncbi:MAG: hypothetical protein BWK79_02115 [Beggiatoa sp. IS2]|nr:MAG: hypothetical protein BWK79_02115 [Beggiatoa sp. IS2]